jgi:hypothetical protein
MGFRYWYEGILFISFFAFIVGLPCVFVTIFGTKMINDLGNFPTKTAKIQVGVLWKLVLVEVVSFALLTVFFRLFS